MTINALICDDQIQCTQIVQQYLVKYCDERNYTCFCDLFDNGEKALNATKRYDIAFLDIEVGNINGLDIAKKLKEKNNNIIIFFITEYEKYIDDAMDLFALRFIKKPLDYVRFYSGLDKAIELINEEVIEIYLKDSNKVIKIKSEKIMYIETQGHKVKIVTTEGVFYSSDLLDFWQKKLTHISFFRVHKSYIVNLNYIEEYKRIEIKLNNGEIIPVSHKNQSTFRKYFFDYLQRRK